MPLYAERILVREYDGSSDVRVWLRHVNLAGRLQGWSEQEKILNACFSLYGEAELCMNYESYEILEQGTWEQFGQKLEKWFPIKPYSIFDLEKELYLISKGPLSEYLTKFQRAQVRLDHKVSDELLQETLLRNLPTSINMMFASTPEKTVEETFEILSRMSIIDEKQPIWRPSTPLASSGKKCFACDQLGHLSRSCPQKAQSTLSNRSNNNNQRKPLKKAHLQVKNCCIKSQL